MTALSTPHTDSKAMNKISRAWLKEHSMTIGYVILFALLSATVENFFSTANVVGLMLSVAQIGMVACTMMLCLASRDFDLSVGSIIAFSGVLGAIILERTISMVARVAISALTRR